MDKVCYCDKYLYAISKIYLLLTIEPIVKNHLKNESICMTNIIQPEPTNEQRRIIYQARRGLKELDFSDSDDLDCYPEGHENCGTDKKKKEKPNFLQLVMS